eukprot:13107755-Ditylum_brightwellii.AAC.1
MVVAVDVVSSLGNGAPLRRIITAESGCDMSGQFYVGNCWDWLCWFFLLSSAVLVGFSSVLMYFGMFQ